MSSSSSILQEEENPLLENQSHHGGKSRKFNLIFIGMSILLICSIVTILVLGVLLARADKEETKWKLDNVCDRIKDIEKLLSASNQLFRENRERLITFFKTDEVLYIEGGKSQNRNADTELLFRQRSNFLYATGVEYPGCSVLIQRTNDEQLSYTILFVPKPTSQDAIWNGKEESLDELKDKFDMDEVHYSDDFDQVLSSLSAPIVYLEDNFLLPSNMTIATNITYLSQALFESRTIKTEKEVELMTLVSEISSDAHVALMETISTGLYEFSLESTFLFETYNCGLRHQAYIPIVGSGYNSAVLHYNKNDKKLKKGEILLVDAAGEFKGYASDITRSYPVDGEWSQDQKDVYQIVLDTQKTVIDMLAPGVSWQNVSAQTSKSIVEGLLKYNFINGDLDELLEYQISRIFLPHGVGHFVGLDVHDTYSRPDV